MLTRLFIKNIALIKESELEFDAGFSVITGETGAGKSMLMDALGLTLGARAEERLIRAGGEQAVAEATFAIKGNHPVAKIVTEQGVELDGGELILRRVLTKGGSSKAFVNGMRITQSQLADLGSRLADIHGQHDHQMLLKPARHGEILDRFGHLKDERIAVRAAFLQWQALKTKLDDTARRNTEKEKEEELLKAWLDELDALAYEKGEEDGLIEERKRLASSEKVIEALYTALHALNAENDLAERLGRAERAIEGVLDQAGKDVEQIFERVGSLYAEAADLTRDLEGLTQSIEPDPDRLQQVDDRLVALRDAARKHNVDVSELGDVHSKLSTQLDELSLLQESITDLQNQVKSSREAFDKACEKLTKARQKVAKKLAKEIEAELKHLKMADTKFEVELKQLPTEEWNRYGAERIEFLVAVNPGSPMLPLVKVASGGEVSRLMLALKTVFYTTMPPMTIVFDEIDTGIGGAVAEAAGQAMRKLSKNHQVFAITHQPQVAASGAGHIRIDKTSNGKDTQTSVHALSKNEREEEIARMLAGKEVTDSAREAARTLLKG